MINTIEVNGIKLHANHGCLIEEAKIGGNYVVDVTVKTDFKEASLTDELAKTVDYVDINKIVQEEMAIRSKLLEEVAKRILDRILIEIPMVKKADIAVSKLNPPIGGNVAMVTIEMSRKR